MGQNNIKGLSILMNMKDVGVGRTLKQIKGQFKTLSSEMRRSSNDFKHTEKSMETFTARSKELKRGIDLTQQSMKDISNRLRKMTLEEQRTSAEAEKLRQEYSRQHQALNMYKRQLNATEQEMKQFNATGKRSNQSVERTTAILAKLRQQLNVASMSFDRGTKSTNKYKQYLDELSSAINKHKKSIQVLETRYGMVAREQGKTSQAALNLKQKILEEKKSLDVLENQFRKTTAQSKQFSFEQRKGVQSVSMLKERIAQIGSALKVSNAQFNVSNQSTVAYQRHIQNLSKAMTEQRAVVQNLGRQYAYARREYGANSKQARELGAAYFEEKQKLKELDSQLKKTTEASKRFAFEQRTSTMSMSAINEKIKQTAAMMRNSASAFKMSGQTLQAYKARISELNNSMKQQQLIVQNLSRQYDYARKAYGANSAKALELKAALLQEKATLKTLNQSIKESTFEHNRLKMQQQQGVASMSTLRNKMSELNDTLTLSRSNFTRAGESTKAYKTHLSTLTSTMTKQRSILKDLEAQYRFVAQSQGQDSAKARELSSAIVQQKVRMNELRAEIKQTSAAYQQLAASQQQAQSLGATGFGRAIQSVNKYGDSIKNVGMNMRAIGSGAMIYMAMPAVAAMGTAIKSSIEWEQALAGVAKTTDMSGSELRKMGDEITAMSNKMPFAATEIAGVAEAAGQLGVKKKDITAFTETMMHMGVATNLTAEEAATEFARFANAAKMPIKDVDRLGATVTALGNTTATTEKEIVEMAQRLAGAGAQAGFSADQIMAISASMSSVGIEAEAGGTAMTQIFNKMTRAVANGGSTLDSFAKTSGVSAKEFADTWENNPSKALSMFVKGLSNTEGGAKGVLKALDDVGIKGIREADTIRRMSNNHKVLDDALRTGAKGWKENTALTDEAAIRYETMGSKLKILKNTFINFARTIGDAVAPIISKLADVLTGLFKHLQQTSTFTKIVIAVFSSLAIAIPPLIVLTGLLASGIVNIANAMVLLNKFGGGTGVLGGLRKGFTMLLGPIGQVATKIPLIGSAMTLLTGPIGIAIAAIAAIGTAFVIAYKKSETFRNIVNKVISPVTDAFKKLWGVAQEVFSALGKLLKGDSLPTLNLLSKIMPKETATKVAASLMQIRQMFIDMFNAVWQFGVDIGNKLKRFWDENGEMIMKALDNIWQVIVTVFTEIKNFLWPILQELGNVFKTVFMNIIVPAVQIGMKIIWEIMKFVWPLIQMLVVDTWNNIKNIINAALDVILGIVKIFGAIFTGQWKEVWEGVKQVFSGMLVIIWNLVQLWLIGKILKVVKMFGGFFKEIISTAFNGVKSVINGALSFIWSIINSVFRRILSLTRSIFTGVFNIIKTIWSSIRNVIVNAVKAIYNNVKNTFTALKNITRTIFNSIKTFAINVWNTIKNKIVGYVKSMYNSIKNTFNKLASVTRSIFNGIRTFLNGIWRKISSYVVSVVKNMYNSIRRVFNSLNSFTRNLFNKLKNFMNSVWRNIKNTVTKYASQLWAGVKKTFNNMYNGTRNIINKVKRTVTGAWKDIKKSVTGTASSMWSSVKKTFNNMNSGLKNIIGKIKGNINGMVKSVKTGLNKLIKGVNWVGDKLGMKKIPEIKLHTGTESTHTQNFVTNGKINRDTFATVGDKGRGNGPKGFRHEMIRYPNGKMALTPNKDTTAFLPKGSSVYNGAQTHSMLSSLPRFSTGTSAIVEAFGKKPKKGKHKDHNDVISTAWGATKQQVKNAKDGIVEGSKNVVSKALETAVKGKDWFKEKIGDVIEWVEKPGKLLDKVLEGFGLDLAGFGIPKKAKLPYDMMKGMFSKLKKAATSTIGEWLEEMSGGDGDGSYIKYLDNITTPYSPNGPPPGYPFGWAHPGIDLPYINEKVQTPLGGTARTLEMPGGFGHYIRVMAKPYDAIFGHLSKWLVKDKQRVVPGDVIGISGSTGASTGPHLHFEMLKHGTATQTGTSIDPVKWLKSHSGGGKGGKGEAYTRSVIKKAQNILGGKYKGNAILENMVKLARRESNFDPKAVNNWDSNAQAGHPSKGLFQMIDTTFASNAKPGYTNFNNPVHQAMSAMRYIVARYGWGGFPRAAAYAYKSGGLIKTAGWYNLAEGGYPEWIIPTDPNRRSDAMKLLALAANDIQRNKTSSNKRPKQLSNNINTGNNDALLLKMIEQQQQQINLLLEIAKSNAEIERKDFNPSIDKYAHKEQVFNAIDDYNRQQQRAKRFKEV